LHGFVSKFALSSYSSFIGSVFVASLQRCDLQPAPTSAERLSQLVDKWEQRHCSV